MKSRIFIVEDYEFLRKSIIASLEREPDLSVCGEANDVRSALAEISSAGPDLVLTDLQLKDSDGLDLIRALRSHSPKMPVVAMTMFNVRENERLAREAGATDFVAKDRGPENLIKKVRTALDAGGMPETVLKS